MRKEDWIKVGDRLPEDGARVLILYRENQNNRPWDDHNVKMIRYYSEFDINLLTPAPDRHCVTHWMPIELPEEG